MAMPTRLDLVTARLLAPLGAPVLPQEYVVDPNSDIIPALIKYYSHVPLQVTKQYNFWGDREIAVDIDTVMPDYVPPAGSTVTTEPISQPFIQTPYNGNVYDPTNANPSVEPASTYTGKYFYVGVLGYAVRDQLGQSRFDDYLLGLNYAVPNFDPVRMNLNATLIDMNVGDIHYEEDQSNNVIRFVVGGSCFVAVTYGVGSSSIEDTPLRHLELVAWLIGLQYYERILAIRKTGSFKGQDDFEISTDQLERALEYAKTRSEEMLRAVEFIAATKG